MPVKAGASAGSSSRSTELQQQLDAMKAGLRNSRRRTSRPRSSSRPRRHTTGRNKAPQQATRLAAAPSGGISNDLSLWGYGEIYYTHPTQMRETQADLARAVFGIGYQFNDRTRLQLRIRSGACGQLRR